MKLVPFIFTQKPHGEFTQYRFYVFLSQAGKKIWQTDEPGLCSEQSIREDYVEPNGFVLDNIWIEPKEEIAFLQVNPEQTSLSDFYTWEEALQRQDKPECWRMFFFMKDKEKAYWFSPQEILEAEIQGVGNVQNLFDAVLRNLDKNIY